MEYNYSAEDKSQRLRAIIITIAFSVIVLGIAVWAIIAIVSSRTGNNTAVQTTPVVAVTEDQTAPQVEAAVKTTEPDEAVIAEENKAEDTKTAEVTKPAENTETVKKTTARTTTAAKNEVPKTGPEELLPLAMVLGAGTAFAFSKKMVAERA